MNLYEIKKQTVLEHAQLWKINCDLGEGMVNDKLLMPYINTCSIACGGHAGDEVSMRKTARMAIAYKVNIGAHPSFPDRVNFGRKVLRISNSELKVSIIGQVEELKKICDSMNTPLNHIKAHGALYNLANKDENIAMCLLDACKDYKEVPLFASYESLFARMALGEGHQVIYEAFADRTYNNDGSLVDRKKDMACITNPEEVKSQVWQIAQHGTVKSVAGNNIKILADTFCVHGDNPNAVAIVKALNLMIR